MQVKLKKQFLYRVQNENEHNLCQNFNTEKEGVVRNNSSLPVYAGEWVQINVNNYKTHYVKPAQTIEDIAKIYGISQEKILADNNLTNARLFIGQRIKIFNE